MSELTAEQLKAYNNVATTPPDRPLGDVLNDDIINLLISYHEPVISPGRLRSQGGTAPTAANKGPLSYLEFTVGIDEGFRWFKVNRNYIQNAKFHIHWTKSQDTDQSTKNVKWQLEYSVVNGSSEDASVVVYTIPIEDTYDDNGTTSRVVYRTPSTELQGIVAAYYVAMRVTAITPSGVALAEPALISVDMTWEGYGNRNP